MYLHECMQRKMEQHAQLCSNLRAFGWGNVQSSAFIIGHTGAMLASSNVTLSTLGIAPSDADSLLKNIAIASLQKSCAILYTFASQSRESDHQQAHSVHHMPDQPDVGPSGLHEPSHLPIATSASHAVPVCMGSAQQHMPIPSRSQIRPTRTSSMPSPHGLPSLAPNLAAHATHSYVASASSPSHAMQPSGRIAHAPPMRKRRRTTASQPPHSSSAACLPQLHRQHHGPAGNPTMPPSATAALTRNPMEANAARTGTNVHVDASSAIVRPSHGLQQLALSQRTSNVTPAPHPAASTHFPSSPRRNFDPGG